MPKAIAYGSRKQANSMRDKVEEYLAPSDSRVTKTIKLKSDTPDRIVQRVEDDAFASQKDNRVGAGMTELTNSEQQSLKRQHSTFEWQENGFEAMRVKAALERKGVTEWQDYYEPGEGVQSALSKLQGAKSRTAAGGGATAVGGDYTDEEEMAGRRRRQRQSERMQADQTESAKLPAFRGDSDAGDFLREEQQFQSDLFDIAFGQGDHGQQTATGTDVEKLREANQDRSKQARRMDDLRQADITYDPLEWANNKATLDFPGVDTLEPEKKHQARSEQARETDEGELAPIADSVGQWADDMDQYDLPGIDTPVDDGLGTTDSDGGTSETTTQNPLIEDDRAQQDTLGFAADPTEARESRMAQEESTGGLLADTRESVGRGADTNDTDSGEMGTLPGVEEDSDDGPDMSTFMP